MTKWESGLSAFIPCLGRIRVGETWTISPINFSFLSVAIQKQSFMMNYKHIYILNDIATKTLFKKQFAKWINSSINKHTNIKVFLLRGLSHEHIKV